MPGQPSDVQRWVTEGIISADQAVAIEEFERDRTPRTNTAIEILGYVGSAFVLVAALILVGDQWEDLSRAVQVAVAAGAAVVLIVAGLFSTRGDRAPLRRMGQTVLMIAAAPLGASVALATEALVSVQTAVLFGFTAALAYSAIMYLQDRSWAQHGALFASTVGVVSMFFVVTLEGAVEWLPALAVALLGVAWIGLTLIGHLPPRRVGELLGSLATLGGAVVISASLYDEVYVVALSAVAAGTILGVGVSRDRTTLIVSGMFGLIIFLPWLVQEAFGETVGAPLTLLVTGGVLIGSAVYLTRRFRT